MSALATSKTVAAARNWTLHLYLPSFCFLLGHGWQTDKKLRPSTQASKQVKVHLWQNTVKMLVTSANVHDQTTNVDTNEENLDTKTLPWFDDGG